MGELENMPAAVEQTPLASPLTRLSKNVGCCGCEQHEFPTENEQVAIFLLKGFEAEPNSCTCLTWTCEFPDPDQLQGSLPSGLSSRIHPQKCIDISNRLNKCCRRYVTGGFYVFGLIVFIASHLIWTFGFRASEGIPKLMKLIVTVVWFLIMISYFMYVQCVHFPDVDRAMEAECEAITAESQRRYVVEFTNVLVSIDRQKDPWNWLKYVTIYTDPIQDV